MLNRSAIAVISVLFDFYIAHFAFCFSLGNVFSNYALYHAWDFTDVWSPLRICFLEFSSLRTVKLAQMEIFSHFNSSQNFVSKIQNYYKKVVIGVDLQVTCSILIVFTSNIHLVLWFNITDDFCLSQCMSFSPDDDVMMVSSDWRYGDKWSSFYSVSLWVILSLPPQGASGEELCWQKREDVLKLYIFH